jgi:SOS response regulatory protein OraA/RecX
VTGGGERGRAAASAFDRAVRLLAARPHFREELRRKLTQKGHEAGEVEEALARLASLGFLDDAALAIAEAERLRERQGLGRSAIAARLSRKGAGRTAVAAAEAGDDAAGELERAREMAARWLRRGRAEGEALARHLDRKGYPRHVIFRVLKELLPDAEPPGDGD